MTAGPPRPSPSSWSPTTGPTCWSGCWRAWPPSTPRPTLVLVVDNASTDHTPGSSASGSACRCRWSSRGEPRRRRRLPPRGPPGLRRGLRPDLADGRRRGARPRTACVLMAADEDCLMAVREDRPGALVEKAAIRFDLSNPLAIKPKTGHGRDDVRRAGPRCRSGSSWRTSPSRASWSAARWSTRSGCPTRRTSSSTTTSTSPCAPAGPAPGSGRVRDAVLVRQLDFDQQHDLAGWKGYYMYRNLFVVHLRYGENAWCGSSRGCHHRWPSWCSARCAAGGPRRAM